MTAVELKNIAIIALVFAMRMLGLLMVAPVLSLYVDTMPGASLSKVGLAIGIYGLTQAVFQLPFGILSDRFGRKKIVVVGLLLFLFGTVIAALADSIQGVIIGRALQGIGAIGSTLLAWVADLTRETVRTRAMAVVGMSIGLTFVLALILGPMIDAAWGLSGIFQLTAMMAVGGIVLIGFLKEPAPQGKVSRDLLAGFRDLSGLHVSVFTIHTLMTASFIILPLQITGILALPSAKMWQFYVPVLLAALCVMGPFLRRMDKAGSQRLARLPGMAMLCLGVSGFALPMVLHPMALLGMGIVFFAAFTFLEAALPALVSRLAPPDQKGAAMGAYAFSQFLGMFTGGVLGGYLLSTWGHRSVSLGALILATLAWIMLQLTIKVVRRREMASALKPISF